MGWIRARKEPGSPRSRLAGRSGRTRPACRRRTTREGSAGSVRPRAARAPCDRTREHEDDEDPTMPPPPVARPRRRRRRARVRGLRAPPPVQGRHDPEPPRLDPGEHRAPGRGTRRRAGSGPPATRPVKTRVGGFAPPTVARPFSVLLRYGQAGPAHRPVSASLAAERKAARSLKGRTRGARGEHGAHSFRSGRPRRGRTEPLAAAFAEGFEARLKPKEAKRARTIAKRGELS